MSKSLLAAALIMGLCASCCEAWSDDRLLSFLHCRKTPDIVTPEMSVYLRLHPLTLFERKMTGHSTSLGNAMSGYDAYSIGISHLQIRQLEGRREEAELNPSIDPVPLLVDRRTPSSVMVIRGNDAYVFPVEFLASASVRLAKIQDEDFIATFYLKQDFVDAPDNSSNILDNRVMRKLALCNEETSSAAKGDEIRFVTSGLIFRTETQVGSHPLAVATFLDDSLGGWGKTASETIKASNDGPLSSKSVVWVLHRKKPFFGLVVHFVIPVRNLGIWGVNGTALKSLSPADVDPSTAWDDVFSGAMPTDLWIHEGDRLELTVLESVGPFSQLSIK